MNITYNIELFSYWHCGSGLAAGADADLLVIKDKQGLPFVPGKTIKGLIREAAEDILTFENKDEVEKTILSKLFGNSEDRDNGVLDEKGNIQTKQSATGVLVFGNAELKADRDKIIAGKLQEFMYESISSTAIDSNGIAVKNSLRRIQVTKPCVLEGTIYNVPNDEARALLENSMKFIKRLGQNRNRGLGRCKISVTGIDNTTETAAVNPEAEHKSKNILKYKCTLLSDVILNVKSASEGENSTLDFIPGNNFLGIVARHYDELSKEGLAMEIFHSGHVRFGDAHLAVANKRSLKVPASIYYPKLKKVSEECFIHHYYTSDSDSKKFVQLKQCREGFYAFTNDVATPAVVEKTFAIKSAYDRTNRCSADQQMYGYESLNAGAEFYFSVETDNAGLAQAIDKYLLGIQHIGRSRTAQYGLIEIERANFEENVSCEKSGGLVTVYADSRLIFLNEKTNMPTFRPAEEQLGVTSGKIDWGLSQIRTFQYAPWNAKRQCFDTDRCGIEKGSVFVIKDCLDREFSSKYVGLYNNEGFGKVIYNPDFLQKGDDKGHAKYSILEKPEAETTAPEMLERKGSPLMIHLVDCKT